MGVYDSLVLRRLVDWACGVEMVTDQRERIVARARGGARRISPSGCGSSCGRRTSPDSRWDAFYKGPLVRNLDFNDGYLVRRRGVVYRSTLFMA
jgi:2-methylcitrate dehydratase PrpD